MSEVHLSPCPLGELGFVLAWGEGDVSGWPITLRLYRDGKYATGAPAPYILRWPEFHGEARDSAGDGNGAWLVLWGRKKEGPEPEYQRIGLMKREGPAGVWWFECSGRVMDAWVRERDGAVVADVMCTSSLKACAVVILPDGTWRHEREYGNMARAGFDEGGVFYFVDGLEARAITI